MKLFILGILIILAMFAAMLSSMGMKADAILITVPFVLVGGVAMFFLLKFAYGIKVHSPADEPPTKYSKVDHEYIPTVQGVIVRPSGSFSIKAVGSIHTGLIFPDPANDPHDPQDSTDAFTDQQNYRLIHESDRNGPVGLF